MLALINLGLAAGLVMQLDATEVVAGQSVGLTLQLSDAFVARPPSIPATEGATVRFVTQARARQMMNFDVTETQTFRYDVTATSPGDYQIGPLTVDTPGGELRADGITLHVAAPDTSGVDGLVAELGDGVAWVGEVLVYHLEFKTRQSLINARWGPPDSPLLMAEPGVEPVTAEYRLGAAAGAVSVAELWYPFRVIAAGVTTVDAGTLLAQVAVQRRRGGSRDPFFRDLPGFTDTENQTVVSNSLRLQLKALPAGRPAGLSGLVGSFEVSSAPLPASIDVGDTLTVDVLLAGEGAVAGASLPPWPSDGYRVYDDIPTLSAKLSDGKLAGSARFRRAVVPERPGTLSLPPVRMSWFDPESGEYVERELALRSVEVGGAASAASVEAYGAPGAAGTAVAALGDDILPVRTNVSLTGGSPPWLGWLLALPGAGLLAVQGVGRIRGAFQRKVQERTFGFDDLPDDLEGRLAGLERIFRDEAGRRLGRPPPEIKRDDVATLGEEAIVIYRELDLARYRGGIGLPEVRVRAWMGAK